MTVSSHGDLPFADGSRGWNGGAADIGSWAIAQHGPTSRGRVVLKAAGAATAVGALTAVTPAARGRPIAAFAGMSLLAESALIRFGIFEAGRACTLDPKYVVVAQRAATACGHSPLNIHTV